MDAQLAVTAAKYFGIIAAANNNAPKNTLEGYLQGRGDDDYNPHEEKFTISNKFVNEDDVEITVTEFFKKHGFTIEKNDSCTFGHVFVKGKKRILVNVTPCSPMSFVTIKKL